MATAWRERVTEIRIKKAHEALAKSTDCASAWVLLSEEEGSTITHAEKLLRSGLKAAENNFKKSQQMQHHSPLMEGLHSKSYGHWHLILIILKH